MLRRLLATPLVLALGLLATLGLAACGDDDDSAASSSTTEPSEGSVGVDDETYGSECSPVGEDLEASASTTLPVQLGDYAFTPAELEVASGVVTFDATNVGTEPHELAFLPGGGDVPFTAEGAPDEAALEEAGAFELEAFPAGEGCRATYDLAPGTYTLFCIVESPDGETHYEKGMSATLTVS